MTKTLTSPTPTSEEARSFASRASLSSSRLEAKSLRLALISDCPDSRTRSGGFTLIEILVVVALMALVFAAALPGIGSAIRASIENSSRELATTVRATFDEAALKGRVFRVVFDLDKNQYWVEQGPVNLLLMSAEQKEEESKKDARLTEEEREAKPKVSWGIAKSITRDKINLPAGVSFTDVLGSLSKEPIKGGMAYTHVFPHGFIEKTTIHIKDQSSHEATLVVDPVSGKSKLFNSYVKETQR